MGTPPAPRTPRSVALSASVGMLGMLDGWGFPVAVAVTVTLYIGLAILLGRGLKRKGHDNGQDPEP